MGCNIPNVGTKRKTLEVPRRKPKRISGAGLADALFSKVQQRVLGVIFGNPGRSYYATEIIRLAHSGSARCSWAETRYKEALMLSKGAAKKVTIYLNEDAQHHLGALYESILIFLMHKGVSGATATR